MLYILKGAFYLPTLTMALNHFVIANFQISQQKLRFLHANFKLGDEQPAVKLLVSYAAVIVGNFINGSPANNSFD